MFHRKKLSEEDARTAMKEGELSEAIRSSRDRVAIILTQDWCPQWSSMDRWLGEAGASADEPEIDVWELEYNRVPYGNEFMRFKERVLGNDLIPYVRYYRDGKLIGESNYVGRDGFLSRLNGR